ncbi:MAG: tetratricopeptide repeat protein [Thermoplasmata archaeon]|nr:MAG: tetratricopeptide repeat protein [Thermoplasmata archaeon]
MRTKQMSDIPSAKEFIGDLQSKHADQFNSNPPKSSDEMKVMKELIDESSEPVREKVDGHVQVDATLGMKDQEMDINPTFSQYYYAGVSHYEKGNYKESVDYFGKALKINPHHNEAYRYLLKAFYYVRQKHKNIAM